MLDFYPTTRWIVLCLVIATTGCAAPGTTDDAPRSDPSLSWDARFEAPQAPVAIGRPTALRPLRAGTTWYRVEPDRQHPAGRVVTVRMLKADDEAFGWRRHTPDKRIDHLGVDDRGQIVMGATEDLTYDTKTVYDPPLPLLPVGLEPGKTLTFESKITVVNRRAEQIVRDRGTCRRTFVHDADQIVHTDLGRVRCHRIQSTITVKLGLAQVQTSTQLWYAPGKGLIAIDDRETVKALFLSWTVRKRMMVVPSKANNDK